MKNWLLLIAVIVLTFLLLLGVFPGTLTWLLWFVDIILIFATLSFYLVSLFVPTTHTRVTASGSRSKPIEEGLPQIPRTVREILATLSDKQFELFSAAVIMGMGEGYTFDGHCGGSGDQGIDVKLRNSLGLLVGVQSKRYAQENIISSGIAREFWGAILYYNAAYGYLVTTSTFSRDARRVIASASGRIRIIDGSQLEGHLRWHAREIALAWREIQQTVNIA